MRGVSGYLDGKPLGDQQFQVVSRHVAGHSASELDTFPHFLDGAPAVEPIPDAVYPGVSFAKGVQCCLPGFGERTVGGLFSTQALQNLRPLSACPPVPRRFGRGGGCLAGERRGELYHLLALPAGKVLQVSAYAIHGPGQCGVGGRKAQDLFHRVPGLVSQVLPQSAQMSHPFVEWRRRVL
jgi:hypothetical protein